MWKEYKGDRAVEVGRLLLENYAKDLGLDGASKAGSRAGEEQEREIRQALSRGQILVTEDEHGEPVGYSCWYRRDENSSLDPSAYIPFLAIKKEYRNVGVTLLDFLRTLLKELSSKNIKTMVFGTPKTNLNATKLYDQFATRYREEGGEILWLADVKSLEEMFK